MINYLTANTRSIREFYKSLRNICYYNNNMINEQNRMTGRKSVNREVTLENSKAFYCVKAVNMELEQFEYVVTYPKNKTDFDFKERIKNSERKIPVILLFGWGNCKDKHLAKYTKIYEDKGMICIRYFPPNKYFIWEPSKMLIVGRKIANLICELNLNENPIFVHSISNGGATVYLNLSKALNNSPKPINITGIMFDSAPGRIRLTVYYRIISEVFREQNHNFVSLRAFLVSAGVSVIWMGEKMYNLVDRKGTGGYLNVSKYLIGEKYRWPQHFIYSKIDNMIYASDIEKFIECRKKLGIDVTSLSFNDSPHVAHYVYYKDEYTRSVLDFIDKCLNK